MASSKRAPAAPSMSTSWPASARFDLGKTILGQIPAAAQSFVAPFINDIVQGIYAAFSLGVAQTFYIAVGAAIIAAVAAAAMIEHPLRTSVAPAPVASPSSQPVKAADAHLQRGVAPRSTSGARSVRSIRAAERPAPQGRAFSCLASRASARERDG